MTSKILGCSIHPWSTYLTTLRHSTIKSLHQADLSLWMAFFKFTDFSWIMLDYWRNYGSWPHAAQTPLAQPCLNCSQLIKKVALHILGWGMISRCSSYNSWKSLWTLEAQVCLVRILWCRIDVLFQPYFNYIVVQWNSVDETLPTGSKYAPWYWSGFFLTSGDAATKQELYAPSSGSLSIIPISLWTNQGDGSWFVNYFLLIITEGREMLIMEEEEASGWCWSTSKKRMLASLDTAEMWNRLEVIWLWGNWVSYNIFQGLSGRLILFCSIAKNPETAILDLWLVEGLMVIIPDIQIMLLGGFFQAKEAGFCNGKVLLWVGCAE